METKKKSGSGIGRIFSLSLSDAISNKNTTHRNKDRSSGASAHSSPENDKVDDPQLGQASDRCSASDSHPTCGLAHRQNDTATSKNKKKAEVISERYPTLKDSRKDTKRATKSSAKKSVSYPDHGSSSKTSPLSSFKTKTVINDRATSSARLESSSVLLSAETCQEKPSSSSVSQQSNVLHTQTGGKENRPQTEISPQTGCGVPKSHGFENRGHSTTLHKPLGSLDSRKAIGSSGIMAESHARPRTKNTSDRRDNKYSMRNQSRIENHTRSRTYQECHSNQTQKTKVDRSSVEGQCFKAKTTKKPVNNFGPRNAVFADCPSGQSSGKWTRNDEYKSIGIKNACPRTGTGQTSDSAGFTYRSGKYTPKRKPVFQSAGTNRISTGRGKENLNDDPVRESCSSLARQRRGRCGRIREPTVSERSQPILDTSHMDSHASPSSPAQDADDWDSLTPVSIESPGVERNTLEGASLTHCKSQAHMQKKTEKPLSGFDEEKLKMSGCTEAFSNSDKSAVEVWFDVNDDMNKQEHGIDTVHLVDCSSNSAPGVKIITVSGATPESVGRGASLSAAVKTPETEAAESLPNLPESDRNVSHVETEPANIAKIRQANITTRMRGNHRIKSYVNRMNLNEKVEMKKNKKAVDGIDLDDCVQSQSENKFGKNVDGGETNDLRPLETVQTCSREIIKGDTNQRNLTGQEMEVNTVKSFLSVDLVGEVVTQSNIINRDISKDKKQRILDHANECYHTHTGQKPEKESFTQTGQFSTQHQNGSDSCSVKATSHGKDHNKGIKNMALKEPMPLMSLQPRPTLDLLNSAQHKPVFAGTGEGVDSCLPCSQLHASLENPSAGFGRKENRSIPRVSSSSSSLSSSSHTPLSSANGQSENPSISSAASYASLDSDGLQNKMRTWKRSDNACTSIDQSSCGETEKENRCSYTVENDPQSLVHADRISHESSTDTVTESTQDLKMHNDDDKNDGQTSEGSPENTSDANWDSDIEVPNPADLSEPVLSYYQLDANTLSLPSRMLEYDHVKTEDSQLSTSGCLQKSKTSRCGKLRPDTNLSEAKHKQHETEKIICWKQTDEKRIAGNYYCSSPELSGGGCQDKFSNKGHTVSVLRGTSFEASGVVNANMKLFTRKSKCHSRKLWSGSELSNARLKEVQDFDHRIHSTSGSECSESVMSEYLSAGSDVYLKESDADRRCRTWVKKTGNWPVKMKECEPDSQSDNDLCPSNTHHFSDSQHPAVEKYCVSGAETRSDSDLSQPQRIRPGMLENHAKEDRLIEHKPHSPSSHQCHGQVHSLSRSARYYRDQLARHRPARRRLALHDSNNSQAAASQGDSENDLKKTKLPQSCRETDDRQRISEATDRDFSCSKYEDHCCSQKKCVCSDTISNCQCREHHSLLDLSSSNVQTNSSSDYSFEVLSQSDYESSAHMQEKGKKTETHKHEPNIGQSLHTSASNEYWPGFCQDLPYYSPYTSRSLAQSCYSPFHPEKDVWVPAHHPYYDQCYNAWMAYSMGCYGYGFQERDRGMDCSEAHCGQNCGCKPACHQHSRPASRPSSQPPSRPPSSLDNFCRDLRPQYLSPTQSEKWNFTGDRINESNGAHEKETVTVPSYSRHPFVSRSEAEKWDSQQNFTGERSADSGAGHEKETVTVPSFSRDPFVSPSQAEKLDSEQYFTWDRSTDNGAAHERGTASVPFYSDQEACPTQCVQDHIRKEHVNMASRPAASVETPKGIKNEEKDSKVHVKEESSLFQNMSECKNTQNDSVSSDSSWRASASEQFSRTSLLGDHPMSNNGRSFSQCHPKPPLYSSYGSGVPNCRGDFYPCSNFRFPPAFRIHPPMMMASLDPFRFYRPPQVYRAFSPLQASTASSCGVQEERKEGPPYENYPSEQHSYPDCRDLSAFQRARMLHHDPSPDWNLKPQWSLPLPQCPPPPPPPHHPPNYMCPMPRESASQTSCSLPTTPSEPGHLDSSFDTRESYDASSSEQEEAVRGEGVSAKRKRSALSDVGYDKFVAAQKERYLQMYKDSGSEDPDSSSLPSSKQSLQTKTSNDEEEKNSTGSGVIPKCQESSTKNVFHSLYRRAIPISCRDRNRRSCPPAVESTPAVSSEQGSPCDKKPWAPDGLMPAAGLSYMQTVTSPGAWWQQASQPNCVPVGDEDFPSLSATASFVSQHAPLGSGTPTISENSFSKDNVSFSGAKDDGSCENFYRKKAQDEFRGGRWGMSRYASRLLNDNRLSGGKKWGKEAREAFSKPYQTSFVDTHCHLDFLFNREPYSGTYASYREKNKNTFPKNYEACVAVFCRPKSFVNRSKWKPIVEEPGVWMAMGCHPKNATEYTEWTEEGLKQALKHEKTVALGEIGLDYSKHHGQFSAQQKDVFIRQIRIALDMNLPLVIHCREAEDDCLEILEKHVPADYKIHCHCFTSNYESATKWTSRFKNLFIGLTPLITFRSAVGTHEVARLLPLNRLLLETDAPYFLPSGFEWEGLSLSHPGMALMVAIRVAELRGIQVEEVLVQVRRNTQDMYGI